MKKTFFALLLSVIGSFCMAQTPPGGYGPNVGGTPSSSSGGSTTAIVTTNLMADYQMLEGSGTTTADATGQQASATFGGSSPTWFCPTAISLIVNNSLCLHFQLGQSLQMPAALNTARTIQLLMYFQPSAALNTVDCPFYGTTSTANGVCFFQGASTSSTTSGVFSPEQYNSNAPTNTIFTADTGYFVLTFTCPASGSSQLWINTAAESNWTLATNNFGPCTQQTTGNYQLGNGSPGNFYGAIARAVFYSSALTQQQILTNVSAIQTWATQTKALQGGQGWSEGAPAPFYYVLGDSIAGGSLGLPFVASVFLNPVNGLAFKNLVLGPPGFQASQLAFNLGTTSGGFTQGANSQNIPLFHMVSTMLHTAGGVNVAHLQLGTNDVCSAGTPANNVNTAFQNYTAVATALKASGFNVMMSTVLSRGTLAGCDAARDTFNTLMRQHYREVAIGLVDFAEDPLVGADGANANTTWFNGDTIHLTPAADQNLLAHMAQLVINRFLGNKNWTSATTYSVSPAAATSTTAGSCSLFTCTITMGSDPFVAGNCVVIAGVTPAGYNSPAGHCWQVLTSNGTTQFTFANSVSGLGVITIQGTVSVPQDADADQYAILGGSAAGPNHTLQSCMGQTEPIYRMITNTNATPWTITSFASETINGGASLTTPVASATNHPVVQLKPVLVSASAAGCNWQASLQ